ncbi:hypothetical protein MMC18_000395 [Xylographa bjoerkii]|nr:hypothetical protein [Xylographa bjoerkii]
MADDLSAAGCRAGDACPFVHDSASLSKSTEGKSAKVSASQPSQPAKETAPASQSASSTVPPSTRDGKPNAQPGTRRDGPPTVDRSRVVQKPVSQVQVEDPREFQVQQLRRRFSSKETAEADGTALAFSMAPSDPDFPFEMVGLECVLHVPAGYPGKGQPFLDVKNKEMGRGYQINVEKGFDALVAKSPQTTLLGLMNGLDKQLELLLTGQKAETVKLVSNSRTITNPSQSAQTRPSRDQVQGIVATTPPVPEQTFTPEQRRDAAARREVETRQLEARLGRLPLFFKSSDGIAYTLPIEPRRRGDLPVSLQVVKSIRLFVPLMYPLQPCRIEVLGVAREAALKTEKAFEHRARGSSESTLMAHVNYLSQNMHVFATEPVKEAFPEAVVQANIASLQLEDANASKATESKTSALSNMPDDRSHIHVIPRPPEWGVPGQADLEEDSDSSDAYESEDNSVDEDSGVELEKVPEPASTAPERGILLSFPYLELHGIELLELTSLSLTIKCERCKDQMDIKNLRSSGTGDSGAVKTESCKKCASTLNIGYRKELMHANSVRAGHLDLDGCTVVDMLPRCHFEQSDHPNDFANRMICGFCSREQNYRPEDCAVCHAVLIGKRGGGFWEGGKGTRDKTKMSRKGELRPGIVWSTWGSWGLDPRKYKRVGGSKVGKS